MNIIFDCPDFICIDKNSGVLSVPSRTGEQDERVVAGKLLQTQLKIQIYPVHRLDFEVSGCLLFAKNAAAHREANMVFEKHLISKTYQALTLETDFPIKLGELSEWKSKLLRGKKRAYESPAGKDSLTHATALQQLNWKGHKCLLWKLLPITGRSHQLRYEMYLHKIPILGDALYGSDIFVGESKIALRAISIDFSKAHKEGHLKGLPSMIAASPILESL